MSQDDVPSWPQELSVTAFGGIWMFVRWKRRKKAVTKPGRPPRRRSDAGDSLYCVLIESRRIGGKPRQKVVCYLGSVDEGRLDKMWLRVDFWDTIKPKLDGLALTRKERKTIEDSIQRIVPRPSEEEDIQFKKERRRYLLELETMIEIHQRCLISTTTVD